MTNNPRCPACRSENVMFSRKRGVYLCEDCDHEFAVDKPFSLKRVFLSYGHDEHASLAARLHDDLQARGHAVWFDPIQLDPGMDWEQHIEAGLEWLAADKQNAAVILLLTPHAVRRPDGYCLNEVARALSRGVCIIPLMVAESEPPLSICRIQWLDMRECIPIHEKEVFYRPRFERLLKALEEGRIDFEGSQHRLLKAFQPLEFDADILGHVPRFMGRKWVFDAIQQWLAAPPLQRVFWICGGPGVGKTALSAVLSSRYLEVAALHLCKFGHIQKSDPRRVVTSLVYQLTTQLPDYEARLSAMDVERLALDDARTMFDNLLVQPLARINPPERAVVILIDALDEATSEGRNELAGFIAAEFPQTPPWLRLIITSRPEKAVTAPLQGLNPFILDTEREENIADLRAYLTRELAPLLQDRADSESILTRILEQSEGVFLYAERVCSDIRFGNLSLDRIDEFPKGLGEAFWQFFNRQFPDHEKFRNIFRPALRAILAARKPLPVEILQRLFNWQDEELCDFTRTLGSLFPVTKEASSDVIKPYHKSLADWLASKVKAEAYFVSVKEGHRMLADQGWREFAEKSNHLHEFFLRHLALDLIQIGDTARLLTLLASSAFWERSSVFSDESFYRAHTNLLPESCAIDAVASAMEHFATCAQRSSPERLGFTLFPHEPGVVWVNGTHVTSKYSCGYCIPPGAKDPPSEVLWGFLTVCHHVFDVTSALLKGIGSRGAVDWYRDFWTRSRLDDVLCSIDRYYNGCYQHLSDKAGELSWQIDEAAKKVLATQPASDLL